MTRDTCDKCDTCDCRPGQLGDTGIIVLQECGPLKKKGCECDDKEKEDERPKVGIRHQQYSLPHKQIKKNICIQASSSSSSASPARSNSFQPRTLVRPSRRGGVSALARPALASPAPASSTPRSLQSLFSNRSRIYRSKRLIGARY